MSAQVAQPKFRYLITDTFEGLIIGTNDLITAQQYALSTDFFVADTLTGQWFMEDGELVDIGEAQK